MLDRIVAVLAAAAAVSVSHAQINPPIGPVGPSLSEIDQIEPRRAVSAGPITTPGSYYLSGNASSIGSGVIIAVGSVTLDLAGFTLTGDNNGPNDFGIWVTANSDEPVVIKNGTVKNFEGGGVEVVNDAQPVLLHNVSAVRNGFGFRIPGGASLAGCHALNNAGNGFEIGDPNLPGRISNLERCTSTGHGIGFRIWNARLLGCRASGATSTGFIVNDGTLVECIANSNGVQGFNGRDASFVACAATSNGTVGFQLIGGSIEGSRTRDNQIGFEISTQAHARECVSLQDATGATVSFSSLFERSSVIFPSTRGILASNNAIVLDNHIRVINNVDAITVSGTGSVIGREVTFTSPGNTNYVKPVGANLIY